MFNILNCAKLNLFAEFKQYVKYDLIFKNIKYTHLYLKNKRVVEIKQ